MPWAEALLVDTGGPMGPAIASIHEKRAEIRTQIQSAMPDANTLRMPARRRLRDAGAKSEQAISQRQRL